MESFSKSELRMLKKLHTPAKVQDFLNSIPFNFDPPAGGDGGDTLRSPLYVLRHNKAHCFEGALLGAYILSLHGFTPYVLHLKAVSKKDVDHVITPFKQNGLWGALSKTNHAVLRYREPVYNNIRELVMSYFHEYFLDDGTKTLRSYSDPLNLNDIEDGWETLEGDLWGIDEALDDMPHHDIVSKKIIKQLRKADVVERKAGKIVEQKRKTH